MIADKNILDSFVKSTVSNFENVHKIILFGSRANGTAQEDSDYDFAVIMDTDKRPMEAMVDIRLAYAGEYAPMDVLVYRPADLAEDTKWQDFKQNVLSGVVLYDRTNYN